MDVKEAIGKRRAFRSLEPVEISEKIVYDLAESARLSASCFNNQPWRYVFVYNQDILLKMREALSSGNEWAYDASMIIAVFSKKDYDCIIREKYTVWILNLQSSRAISRRRPESSLKPN